MAKNIKAVLNSNKNLNGKQNIIVIGKWISPYGGVWIYLTFKNLDLIVFLSLFPQIRDRLSEFFLSHQIWV